MKYFFTCAFLLLHFLLTSQSLYHKTFGNPSDPALIFLHGGPGYNAVNFEATTASLLAEQGFYVIVYDRRGEGRSFDANATFTFRETFDDLLKIYEITGIQKAALIGHSFGGIIATLFAKKYPKKTMAVILAGAPVALQESFRNIIHRSRKIYTENKDSINLDYLQQLENLDTNTIQYSSFCFMHAMQNGFYTPENPTEEAQIVYHRFKEDSLYKYASIMTYAAPQGFWKNEKYTTLNLTKDLQALEKSRLKIYGIYGKEDGLYAPEQIEKLGEIIGSGNILYWENCSHNVFTDQQALFIDSLVKWFK